jgi:hypothetical protein
MEMQELDPSRFLQPALSRFLGFAQQMLRRHEVNKSGASRLRLSLRENRSVVQSPLFA